VISVEVEVQNSLGLHARPASLFVRKAMQFECEISVEKDGEIVSGKSIMCLMALAASQGTRLRITANGNQAEDALKELEGLFLDSFGEDD
jgi:phosphocarrier protein HPr